MSCSLVIPVALCPADLKPVAPACIKGHVLQLVDVLKLSFNQALSENKLLSRTTVTFPTDLKIQVGYKPWNWYYLCCGISDVH